MTGAEERLQGSDDVRQASSLVLNPDELDPDPKPSMDLAAKLGIGQLENRSAEGANALMLPNERLRNTRALADGGAPGVADADVRARQVGLDGGRCRGTGPPRVPGSAVGQGGHPQFLRQPGHLGEAARVIREGNRAATRAAR